MVAGQLELQLMADIARLQSDLKRAESLVGMSMSRIGDLAKIAKNALGGIAAGLTVGAFTMFIKNAIDAADELSKLSQRTGIATEQLSQLQYAARMSDVSNESLTKGIRSLNVSIAEGLAGDKQKIASFKALGITQKDLEKGTVETMLKIADAYANAKDGAGKAANALKLMGKAGDEMIPMLNSGRSAVIDLMGEAQKLGLTISSDFGKSAEEFNDNLTRLKASGESLAITLGGDLVKSLGLAAQEMAKAAIDGGKLSGVIAFIQTFLTGDDRHKANVEMVQAADEILRIQNEMDKVRARGNARGSLGAAGDAKELANLQKQLDAQQARFNMSKNYAAMLDKQKQAEDAAAKAAENARKNGKDIKDGAAAAAEAEKAADAYDSLLKRVRERIAVASEELQFGRQLSEEEKFQVKMAADFSELQKKYPGLSRERLTAILAESAALSQQLDIRKAEQQSNANFAKEWAKDEQEMSDFLKAQNDERDRVKASYLEQADVLADNAATLARTRDLIGAGADERQLALEQLRIELDLNRQIEKIQRNKLLTEESRTMLIGLAQKNADEAKRQAGERISISKEMDVAEDVRGALRSGIASAFQDGKFSAQSFAESLGNIVYRRLSDKIADALTEAAFGGGKGGGNVLSGIGGVLGGLFQTNYGAVGSTGFGAGAATGADMSMFYAMHTGGIVGSEATFARAANESAFHGAPRFHSGGIAGDEVPIIAQRGEGLFTPAQMRALGGGRGGANVTVQQQIMVGDFVNRASMREELKVSERRQQAGIQRAINYGR